jgi:hypothetical protein
MMYRVSIASSCALGANDAFNITVLTLATHPGVDVCSSRRGQSCDVESMISNVLTLGELCMTIIAVNRVGNIMIDESGYLETKSPYAFFWEIAMLKLTFPFR